MVKKIIKFFKSLNYGWYNELSGTLVTFIGHTALSWH